MLHAGQISILEAAERFNVVACGRRFGKTTLGLALAYYGAPGAPGGLAQRFDVGWFAPTFQIMGEAWRSARAFLKPLIARTDSQMHRIELTNGAAFDFWSLEGGDTVAIGRRYGLVLLDEAAKARYLEDAWNEAIRPTLTDAKGGAWFFSTPKGRNFFWQMHCKGGREDGWRAHHAPSVANPHLDPAEIEQARLSLPERVFAQEYLAQFLDDGGGVFRRVTAAVDSALPTDPHVARDIGDGRAYVIGVDWGRHEDFTVLTVIDAKDRAVVSVDRFTQIDYAIQMARLQALAQRFPRASILAESNSMGGPLVEHLQRLRLPVRAFQTTAASKAEAIEALALAFEQGSLRIPPVQWLVDELMAYDQERLPSGTIRYGALKGGHDDGVMSLAIAWHDAAMGVQLPRRTFSPAGL
jgi:hypothetical protein